MEKHDSRNWKVGDLALCVSTEPWVHQDSRAVLPGPPPGSVSCVTCVATELRHEYLVLAAWPAEHAWLASNFVKVTPPALDEGVLREETYEDRRQ